jgi:2-polyprenyl-6-methoxyphenol hydroxylase-like FAD-dependent oxidoreductase
MNKRETTCVIAGGGPAGIMLGYLLARAGIAVTVCEKWPDFFRDFRGDTIHPSTMELLGELGLLEKFLRLPHTPTYQVQADIGSERITVADFSRLKVRCPYIAMMPQWDFLTFLSGEAKAYPQFTLLMETEAEKLIEENGRVAGVVVREKDGTSCEIRAALTIGADGRHSTLREQSGLPLQTLGAPMDVLWFRISKEASDPDVSLGRIGRGQMVVLFDRGDYWQCGFIIPKGGFEALQKEGIGHFQQTLASLEPFLAGRVSEIADWEKVKLLSVSVDRLSSWHREGLLFIGDAAHAMSPIGGVGVNLAIQDAVAAARILAPALSAGMSPGEAVLEAVERRRRFPTRFTQRLQTLIQKNLISRVLASEGPLRVPFFLRILKRFPALTRIPAFLVGVGVRAEHADFL